MKTAIVTAEELAACKHGWDAKHFALGCIGCKELFDEQGRPCKFGMKRENIVKRIQYFQDRLRRITQVYEKQKKDALAHLEVQLRHLRNVEADDATNI